MTEAPADLVHRLRSHGQEHLLHGWAALSPAARIAFVDQLAGIDFAELEALYNRRNEPHTVLPSREQIAPLPVEDGASIPDSAIKLGEAALRAGQVAALVVAGGQGSRLGFEKPKGMYPIGPVSGASLFQFHAEKVLALSRKFGAPMPLLVMTSHATHAETEAFFHDNSLFGLAPEQVTFFQQGTMPALDLATGQLLLEMPGTLFLSPNGHGGTLTALADSGLLADLKAHGVKHIFYFQVDNPLVAIADPAFVGRHIETESEVSSKVVFKERADEKVGVLALVNHRCGIIEYSDLPRDLAEERDADGVLQYRAGSPAIHVFSVPFLERVTSGAERLAFHTARKKVPHFDTQSGATTNPESENALKFELFVFDALPHAERWLAVSVNRDDEFAPLKNATGADSATAVQQAMTNLAARWLRQAGVIVPTGNTYPVEISPLFALTAEDFAAKLPQGFTITGPILLRNNVS